MAFILLKYIRLMILKATAFSLELPLDLMMKLILIETVLLKVLRVKPKSLIWNGNW